MKYKVPQAVLTLSHFGTIWAHKSNAKCDTQYHRELLFCFSFKMRTQAQDSMNMENSIHSKFRLTFCSTSAMLTILPPGCLAGRMMMWEGGKDRPLIYPCFLQGRQNCSHSHAKNYLAWLGKQQRGQCMQISSWFPNTQGQMHHHWQHQGSQLMSVDTLSL